MKAKMRSLNIPDYWTGDEALVVFEFIDEIRDQIWDHYSLQIQAAARLSRRVHTTRQGQRDSDGQTDLFGDEIQF